MKDLNDPTNVDTIPAMLTEGEFVLNKEATAMYGPLIEQMNNAGLKQRESENKVVKANMGRRMYNTGGLVSFLKEKEGYRDKAYKDSAGVWTIGYGRTTNPDGSPIKAGQTTNQRAEDKWLTERATSERQAVAKFSKEKGYGWGDQQIDAMASFRYNLGPGGFNQLTEGGNRGTEEIINMLPEYNKAGGKVSEGLAKRRQAELDLFTKGAVAPDEVPPQEAPPDVGGAVTNALQQAIMPQQRAPIQHAPMRFAGSSPKYIPSVVQKKKVQTFNQGGNVGLQDQYNRVRAQLQQTKDPRQIKALSAQLKGLRNQLNQAQAAAPQAQSHVLRPGTPSQLHQPSPQVGAGFDPRVNGPRGGGQMAVPQLQGQAPTLPPDAVPPGAASNPRRNNQAATVPQMLSPPPQAERAVQAKFAVPGNAEFADESLLQGSSQQIKNNSAPESVPQTGYQPSVPGDPRIAAAPPPPPAANDWASQVDPRDLQSAGYNPDGTEMTSGSGAIDSGIIGPDNVPSPEYVQAQIDSGNTTPHEVEAAQGYTGPTYDEVQGQKGKQAQVADAKPDAREEAIRKQPDAVRAPKVQEVIDTVAKEEPAMENQPSGDQLVQAGLGAGKEKVVEASNKLKDVFGDLFDSKELARMAVVFAGAMLTGASPGQALSISGQMYLNRIDTKAAQQTARVDKLVSDGDYTPRSIKAYSESGDIDDLVPVNPTAAYEELGNYKTFYSDNGQRIRAREVKQGDSKFWIKEDGTKVNPYSHTEDASAVRGTQEYSQRIKADTKQYTNTFGELQERFGKFTTKDGNESFATDLTPGIAGGQIAKWALDQNVPPEYMSNVLQNAYETMRTDAKESGRRISDITPYLNEQYIKAQVGTPELFKRADGGWVSGKKLSQLMTRAGNKLRAANPKAFGNMSNVALSTNIMQKFRPQWLALPESMRTQWDKKAGPGSNGLMAYITSELNDFDAAKLGG